MEKRSRIIICGKPAKSALGAFECEFSPAVAVAHAEESLENLPSRGEINEVRHDNAKLRNQVELLREEVEALSKAPSEGSGGDAVTLPREEFVRIVGELEKLKESQLQSGEELKRLKNNLSVLQRDRANLQRALDDARSETLKARSAPAPAVSARAIPRDEPVTAPEGAAVEESPEAAAAPEAPAETPPPFKPAGRPPIQPGKLSVPNPQTLPAKGPTVTQPQPFAPASAPKAQPGSGSGIRPFPKANPPGTVSKPALAGAHPIAQGDASQALAAPTGEGLREGSRGDAGRLGAEGNAKDYDSAAALRICNHRRLVGGGMGLKSRAPFPDVLHETRHAESFRRRKPQQLWLGGCRGLIGIVRVAVERAAFWTGHARAF